MIDIITPNVLREKWDSIYHLIKASCEYGEDTPDQIFISCLYDKNYLIGMIRESVIVLQLTEDSIHIRQYGGSTYKGIAEDLSNHLVHLAKVCNVKHVTLAGRKGWYRIIKHLGYQRIAGGTLCLVVDQVQDN